MYTYRMTMEITIHVTRNHHQQVTGPWTVLDHKQLYRLFVLESQLQEQWKTKPDQPGISQPEELTKTVVTVACSTTTAAWHWRRYLQGVSGAVSWICTVLDHKQLYRRFVLRSTTPQPSNTLPDCDQPLKALELWEMRKTKHYLPGISQQGQLT